MRVCGRVKNVAFDFLIGWTAFIRTVLFQNTKWNKAPRRQKIPCLGMAQGDDDFFFFKKKRTK